MSSDDENNKTNKVDEEVFEVTRLVDIDLANGVKNALKECLASNISVFINSPVERSLWGLAKNFRQFVEKYEKEEQKYPSSVGISMFSPILIELPCTLLQLSTEDIKKLCLFSKTEVMNFQRIIQLEDVDTGFKFVDTCTSHRWHPEQFSPSYTSEALRPFSGNENTNYINKWIDLWGLTIHHEKMYFTLCQLNKKELDAPEDPLPYVSAIEITLDDCFIQTKSESKLIKKVITEFPQIDPLELNNPSIENIPIEDEFTKRKEVINDYLVSDIPKKSPYFVPEGYRHSSLLNNLAVLGYEMFEDQSIPLKKNLDAYIQLEFSINKKHAEAAAFFITPKTKGSVNDEYKGQAQFKFLFKIFGRFYSNGIFKVTDKKRYYAEVKDKYGYTLEKIRNSQKLFEPDKK